MTTVGLPLGETTAGQGRAQLAGGELGPTVSVFGDVPRGEPMPVTMLETETSEIVEDLAPCERLDLVYFRGHVLRVDVVQNGVYFGLVDDEGELQRDIGMVERRDEEEGGGLWFQPRPGFVWAARNPYCERLKRIAAHALAAPQCFRSPA
jgi:hypothetical protein